MSMRPFTDPYTNPSGILDQKFGQLYEEVKNLSDNIDIIRHVSNYMQDVTNVNNEIAAIQAIGASINALSFVGDNLSSLAAYLAALDVVISSKADTKLNNDFIGFNGFGELSTPIKQKLITTTPLSTSSTTNTVHLLDQTKIVSFVVTVTNLSGITIHPDNSDLIVNIDDTNVNVTLGPAAVDLVGRPIYTMITYIE